MSAWGQSSVEQELNQFYSDALSGPVQTIIKSNDRPENLVDDPQNLIRSVQQMEDRNLMSSSLEQRPWSGDYWPVYRGILGSRYADKQFRSSAEWENFFDYIKNAPAIQIFQSEDTSQMDFLSPSEKYDAILGDTQGSLTQKMWQEGQNYKIKNGSVEHWMGICDGWAAASYMLPRPINSVQVLAADGKTTIHLYPTDIKGLAAYLWAKTKTKTRFIGGRCNTKSPATDKAGHVFDPNCFDTNPGTWHMSVVNQIGISHRSFIMNADYDYEVWNQPIFAYSYTYFNPQTLKEISSFQSAVIPIEDFKKDKFKKYRSPDTRFIVGISMKVTYTKELAAAQRNSESPDTDIIRSANYLYDLELDNSGNIIGGEWYKNLHPDFLWTPAIDAHISDPLEQNLSPWSGSEILPQDWRDLAIQKSQKGMVMSRLVDELIRLSQ